MNLIESVALTHADTPVKSSSNIALNKEIERARCRCDLGLQRLSYAEFPRERRQDPQKDWLTGGVMGWRGPWGKIYPTKLRLYFQEITEGQWVQVAKECSGVRPCCIFR